MIVEDDELFPDEYPNILVVPHRLADHGGSVVEHSKTYDGCRRGYMTR